MFPWLRRSSGNVTDENTGGQMRGSRELQLKHVSTRWQCDVYKAFNHRPRSKVDANFSEEMSLDEMEVVQKNCRCAIINGESLEYNMLQNMLDK